MPPQSRGQLHPGLQSKSTPNLPTLGSLARSLSSSTTSTARGHASPFPAERSYSHIPPPDETSLAKGDLIDGTALDSQSDDSASSSSDNAPISNLHPQRPLYTHHSRSHSHLLDKPSAPLAPPFYNRPPTPLPPSPSLTSLLRPSFTSRPTTPDSSDHEASTTTTFSTLLHPSFRGGAATNGTATPASSTTTAAAQVSTSAARAPPRGVPRAHPRVPTYEYYGFVLYLCSSAAFLGYLLWAYLPSPLLHALGIRYYPNRWWAVAVPAWLVVALGTVYVVLAGWNTEVLTLPMGSCEALVDRAAQVAVVDEAGEIVRGGSPRKMKTQERRVGGDGRGGGKLKRGQDGELNWRQLWNEGTDAVMDVPIGGVCKVLYGEGREEWEDGQWNTIS
ncbi:MAG: hypothetical protein M1821_006909 [Bathelium mastoideum]|nr:MAG: hypothetical protein M1821_006909 [Bathelium mastoideum]KAI9687633.1 MAG: hypothetical protein M1822_002243 [Bathelium mastoideum]